MIRVAFWLALFIAAVALLMALGCSAVTDELDANRREDIEQWHAIRTINRRLDDIEVGRNSPAEGYEHHAGDGR